MNQEQIDAHLPIIEKYNKIGWFINKVGAGPDGFTFRVKSPRMNYPMAMYEPFVEEDLLIDESRHVAAQNHMEAISTAFSSITHKMIADLGNLYLLQSRGKEGVIIPDELTLNDVKIPLKIK